MFRIGSVPQGLTVIVLGVSMHEQPVESTELAFVKKELHRDDKDGCVLELVFSEVVEAAFVDTEVLAAVTAIELVVALAMII